jgi:hydrogenase expression/formation protein HypC
MAEVDFGGVRQQVSLACLPQARVGDRVLVHVGFALSLVEDELEPSP